MFFVFYFHFVFGFLKFVQEKVKTKDNKKLFSLFAILTFENMSENRSRFHKPNSPDISTIEI